MQIVSAFIPILLTSITQRCLNRSSIETVSDVSHVISAAHLSPCFADSDTRVLKL